MLIPSIDLMGGKIVQLIQGQRKALEFNDFEQWIARFSAFPLVQLIDLDAAMGTEDNRVLVREFTQQLPCQVGGGIRSIESAELLLSIGAKRVILGSSLIRDSICDTTFAQSMAQAVGADKLVFAVDSKQGRVAIRGWRELTSLKPLEVISALESWCAAFLYTHIDTEGLMQAVPLGVVRELRNSTKRELIVAGGIATHKQVDQLDALGVHAVVGMAIYTGAMSLFPPGGA